MPWGLYKTRGDSGIYLTFKCESFTSIFSMFASRSLKEKSCSMEVFFSFIVVVCSSGMMFPGSFRLFVTWKYKSRKFYRNKVGRFSFHWSEVFSYEKKNQKKYWKKRHTENDNKYRVILFVCNSQGFNVSNNDVNKKQYIPRFFFCFQLLTWINIIIRTSLKLLGRAL